jgi:sn-glycerol 3-phosphate transport system substrate-binding protein
MRRRPLAGALAAVAIATAVACSEPPTSGGGEAVSADDLPECPLAALEEAAADGPVDVTLWYGGLGGTPQAVMEGMATRFNASQDDVRVTASNQGESYAEVYRKFDSAASASTSQLPDVIYLEDTQLRAMVDSGRVLPAQSCMEADGYDMDAIEPVVRSTYTVEDVLYPGYMNVSTPVLYFNRAHFVEAGLDPDDPPGTLDELRETALALKEAGVSDRPFSLKMSRWFVETWLSGVGVDVVDQGNGREGQATEANLDTPEARELLAFLQQMNEDGLLNPFAETEGSIDHYLALVSEDSSMLVETSVASSTIRDALGGNIDPGAAGVDVSTLDAQAVSPGSGPFPGIEEPGQVRASGGAFYILNTSDPAQQAASWKFLQFMLQPENAQEWYVAAGYLPVDPAIYDTPEAQAFNRDDVAGVLLRASYEQLGQADPERPGPLIGPYPDFAQSLQRAIESVILDGADPADALAEADDAVTESLQRYAGD